MSNKSEIKKTPLMEQYEKETGKNAIWLGRITKQFSKWKARKEREKPGKITYESVSKSSILSEIQSNIKLIFSRLDNFENRLKIIEREFMGSVERDIVAEVSPDHFLRILKIAYNSIDKKFEEFVPISTLTEKIKQYIPWPTEKIHSELYKLFIDYKIDLQPGKKYKGEPLRQDGKSFVWFKFKISKN